MCQPQPVYLVGLCAILVVKRRSHEEQAVKLLEALNGKIEGVFHLKISPLVSVALLPLFSLSTQKLIVFEHGRDWYKLRRATLYRPCTDTDIYEFSP